MEYMNGGSLLNLLESVGALPENILMEITDSVLNCINFLHNKAKISHNGLSMSQIMFDRDGKIKLNLGISQILPKEESSYKSSLGPSKLNLYHANEINSPARIKKFALFSDVSNSEGDSDQEKIQKEIFAQDIFDLGYILLVSATGGLDLINQETLDFGTRGDSCCLLHWCEKVEKKANNICISDLLKDRYSPEFSDFLCKCLRFDFKERETTRNLMGKDGHPWLQLRTSDKYSTLLKVSVKELLKISGEWKENKVSSTQFLDDFKSNRVDKLIDFIECVEYTPTAINKSKIKKVAEELGIDEEYLQKRLKEIDFFNN